MTPRVLAVSEVAVRRWAPAVALMAAKGRAMATRWNVNITPGERVGRILLGLTGTGGGILFLAGFSSLPTSTLEVVLVLAGLKLVVTGATGHCPPYQKLGHLPRSLRQAR